MEGLIRRGKNGKRTISLQRLYEAGSLAFTVAGVPVIYRLAESQSIAVFGDEGDPLVIEGGLLGRELSESLFRRERRIRRIVVDIPEGMLR